MLDYCVRLLRLVIRVVGRGGGGGLSIWRHCVVLCIVKYRKLSAAKRRHVTCQINVSRIMCDVPVKPRRLLLYRIFRLFLQCCCSVYQETCSQIALFSLITDAQFTLHPKDVDI